MSDLKLSPEQMVFMLKNHELMERAIIEAKKGNPKSLDEFIASDEFQSLLGEIGWDDAYDRYQDMPEYDSTLTRQLHKKLQQDISSGKVQIPTNQLRISRHNSVQDDDISLETLTKFNKAKISR